MGENPAQDRLSGCSEQEPSASQRRGRPVQETVWSTLGREESRARDWTDVSRADTKATGGCPNWVEFQHARANRRAASRSRWVVSFGMWS